MNRFFYTDVPESFIICNKLNYYRSYGKRGRDDKTFSRFHIVFVDCRRKSFISRLRQVPLQARTVKYSRDYDSARKEEKETQDVMAEDIATVINRIFP